MTIWWPDLPQPLDGTFEEEPIAPWVEDPADAGAPRRRANYSRMRYRFRWQNLLTRDSKEALKTFYVTTCSNGVSSFDWIHPDSDEQFAVRFSELPRIRHRTVSERHVGLWLVQITIETI